MGCSLRSVTEYPRGHITGHISSQYESNVLSNCYLVGAVSKAWLKLEKFRALSLGKGLRLREL